MRALGERSDWAAVTANGIQSGSHRTSGDATLAKAAWRYQDWFAWDAPDIVMVNNHPVGFRTPSIIFDPRGPRFEVSGVINRGFWSDVSVLKGDLDISKGVERCGRPSECS